MWRSCASSSCTPSRRRSTHAALARYPNAVDLVWCQEEPQNQGAWFQIRHRLQELAGEARPVYYAGRAPAAAPATGLARIHQAEQRQLVQAALSGAGAELGAADGEAPRPAPASRPLAKKRNN